MTSLPADNAPLNEARSTDPADSAAVGQRIRALREGMGLSLRELALRCGVGAATLSQVERGESSPTLAATKKASSGGPILRRWRSRFSFGMGSMRDK